MPSLAKTISRYIRNITITASAVLIIDGCTQEQRATTLDMPESQCAPYIPCSFEQQLQELRQHCKVYRRDLMAFKLQNRLVLLLHWDFDSDHASDFAFLISKQYHLTQSDFAFVAFSKYAINQVDLVSKISTKGNAMYVRQNIHLSDKAHRLSQRSTDAANEIYKIVIQQAHQLYVQDQGFRISGNIDDNLEIMQDNLVSKL
jgi:hypothetical protein